MFSRTTDPEKFKFTWRLPDAYRIRLLKSRPPRECGGVMRGYNRENHFYMCLYMKKLLKSSQKSMR
jgi:hypothetical protein